MRRIALLGILSLATRAGGQTLSAIEGMVRDPTGRAVAGATIVLVTADGDTVRRVATRSDGEFLVLGLESRRYTLRVRALGLTPIDDSLDVAVGQRLRLDYRMSRATTLAAIEVRQSRLSTQEINRRSVSSVITAGLAEELPFARPSPLALPGILPGVRSYAPVRGRSFPTAGAGPPFRLVSLYLDGISLKNMTGGNLVGIPQTGAPFPQGAISEMRFSLSAYGAEQGHGSSWGINAVTHRGDDTWRRTVFARVQPVGVTAKTFLERQQGRPAAPARQAILGGSARGPIGSRLYYAGTVELSRLGDYASVNPSDAWASYRGSFETPGFNATALQRLTWVAGRAHEVDALWLHRTYDAKSGIGEKVAYDAGVSQRFNINVAQLRSRRSGEHSESEWSAQLVSWVQKESPLVPGAQRVYPGITRGESRWPFDLTEVQARLVHRGALAVGTRRRHLLRYGAEVGRFLADEFRPINRDGALRFDTDTSMLPSSAVVSLGFLDPSGTGEARVRYRGTTIGAWVTDEWRPTSRLLLTAGVRYDADLNLLNNDFVSPWVNDSVLTRASVLRGFLADGRRQDDLDNLAPRVSLSYDLQGRARTFVRAGFGLTFDRAFTSLVAQEARSARWRTYTFQSPGTSDIEELRRRVAAGLAQENVSPTMVKATLQAPEARSVSVGIGHRLTPDWALNIDVVHQSLRHLATQRNANPRDTTRRRVLSPLFGDIVLWDDNAQARYDALLAHLTYERPQAQLQVAYTLARARTDVPGTGAQAFPLASRFAMEPTVQDERHRVVVSGFARLGWGLTLSTITTLASPRPYTAIDGRDRNRNNIPFDDFAFSQRTTRPGNAWRNWYRNVDLRAARSVAFGGARVSLSVDVTNAFNAANISAYGGQWFENSVLRPIPSFGMPTEAFAARSVQFGVKSVF
ncbi:MAG: carboxypeptidase regulatory-like domain-containing protein [Gemmatimonadetes bacterium]|nr:carboxypeptidase regulatory-like domain-containing protein [Gemmatimonadota bacterium]